MRHAIMVLGSGNDAQILQKLIEHFDDPEIDFFIHWDLKYKLPRLKAKKSHISFVPRIKVYWGTSTQVFAEQKLLQSVWKSKEKYDYIHLISSTDIPLMTKQYFKCYFNKPLYLGFSPRSKEEYRRLSFYYPIDHCNIRNHKMFMHLIKAFNILLHIDRLENKNIVPMKGPNWFSIRSTFLPTILNYGHMDIFNHSFLSDETYLQTILGNYRPEHLKEDNKMAARYIDWHRGKPYVFTKEDIPELKEKVNTRFAFARKVEDPRLINGIFNDL